jgi:hypothetical protein
MLLALLISTLVSTATAFAVFRGLIFYGHAIMKAQLPLEMVLHRGDSKSIGFRLLYQIPGEFEGCCFSVGSFFCASV